VLSSPILNQVRSAGIIQVLCKLVLAFRKTLPQVGSVYPFWLLTAATYRLALPAILLNGEQPTPLNDNEIIVVIQNNQVAAQLPGGAAGKLPFRFRSMDTCWSYEPIALPLRTCPWALLYAKAPPNSLLHLTPKS